MNKNERTTALVRALDVDRARFDVALAALKKAAVKPLALGPHVARSPWSWLLTVTLVGIWIGWRKPR